MPTTQDSAPDEEGPLARAARVASDRSYLDGLVETRRGAWERASGARPQRTPKRLLVSLSHSIEKAVIGGPIEFPTVVVALFQELRFFDREREVYARMAAAGAIVVVGFVEGSGHELPRGVHGVMLRPDEPLADEWSVVAVSPVAGAFLVATDQHSFDPNERDHEASREFVGRWGYSRAQASTELARLRFSLGNRLDVVLRGTIDDLLAAYMPTGGDPAASAGTPGEMWATTSLGHMMNEMLTARAGTRELREQLADAQAAAAARSAATTDPQSGLANPDFLQRWSHPTGADPLPIGLALFDVAELGSEELQADERAAYFAAHQVAAALGQPLGPVDAVVRVSPWEFLVVVPGASTRHLAGLCDRIGEQLELASHGYPDVALRARVASTVTRCRPLPVDGLRAAFSVLDDDGGSGPSEGGEVGDGDRVVVASTALHAAAVARSRARTGAEPATGTDAVDAAALPLRSVPDDGGTGGPDRTAGAEPDGVEAPVHVDGPVDADRDVTGTGRFSDVVSATFQQEPAVPPRPAPAPPTAAPPALPPALPSTVPLSEPPVGSAGPAPGPRPAPTPPRPRPEVSPFGHTGSRDPDQPAPSDAGPGRRGGHRARDDDGDTGHAPPSELPQRTAQEALHRLVYGDGSASPGGDPRARSDVFADLSDPPNGHGPRR